MSGSSGDTLIINQSLNGNVTLLSGAAPVSEVTIEPDALTYNPPVDPTSSVQIDLGGNLLNFGAGDTIVLANVEQDYAVFDALAGSSGNNVSFDNVLSAAASAGLEVFVEPGDTITTNDPLFNAGYGTTLQSLTGPYLQAIDQALFGPGSITETLTITPTFETSAHTTVDAVITTSQTVNPCFTTGTLIRTTRGDVPVEILRDGDTVVTESGGTRFVVWIGRRHLDFTCHPEPDLARPVRIAAGALADGVPARDLVVSPDHAMMLDGVLVQARDLVDGVLITRDDACREVTYWHVELDTHDVLIAEGAAAESYLDTGHRGFFENGGEPLDLHPDLMTLAREVHSCAPLVTDGARLEAIRVRLAARRRAMGIEAAETVPMLRAGGALVMAEMEEGRLRFPVPAGCGSVDLLVGAFVPAEVDPRSADRRRLGIAIAAIVLAGVQLPIDTAIDPAALHPRASGDAAIWTRGDATIRFAPAASDRFLEITYTALPRRWTRPETARAA